MQNVAQIGVKPRSLDLTNLSKDEIPDVASEFLKEEIARLEKQVDALNTRVCALDVIELDDKRMRQRLQEISGPLTVEDLTRFWDEVTRPERERAARETLLHIKSARQSSVLQYFTITNARRNTIHILADDASVARHIAWANDRITDKSHGNLRTFDQVSIERLPYARAIEAAIAGGWPGEIEIMGDKIVHRNKKTVYG